MIAFLKNSKELNLVSDSVILNHKLLKTELTDLTKTISSLNSVQDLSLQSLFSIHKLQIKEKTTVEFLTRVEKILENKVDILSGKIHDAVNNSS